MTYKAKPIIIILTNKVSERLQQPYYNTVSIKFHIWQQTIHHSKLCLVKRLIGLASNLYVICELKIESSSKRIGPTEGRMRHNLDYRYTYIRTLYLG